MTADKELLERLREMRRYAIGDKDRATLTAAIQRIEQCGRDAERYRWLRGKRATTLIVSFFGNGCVNRTIEEVDAAIDAALAEKGAGK